MTDAKIRDEDRDAVERAMTDGEARAKLVGPSSGAQAYVNFVRSRAALVVEAVAQTLANTRKRERQEQARVNEGLNLKTYNLGVQEGLECVALWHDTRRSKTDGAESEWHRRCANTIRALDETK